MLIAANPMCQTGPVRPRLTRHQSTTLDFSISGQNRQELVLLRGSTGMGARRCASAVSLTARIKLVKAESAAKFVGMSEQNQDGQDQGGIGTVIEQAPAKTKPPPMFQVVLLNDDYTPMEFVVGVLQRFFGKGREQATQVMLKVHREGKGVCGIYPQDIAASKVEQVTEYAQHHQHPLQCIMEQV
jgi:ATP-dependent Clp protease adaptor protein ClpS